ncbi:MAG: ATP-binding protein [Acidobacteriota bacterium]
MTIWGRALCAALCALAAAAPRVVADETTGPTTAPSAHSAASELPAHAVGAALIRTYPREEHGGYFQTFAIAQDPNGLVYAANNSGLLEYDGERWHLFELPRFMPALAIDDRGQIWLGGANDLGRMVPTDTGELVYESLVHLLPEQARDFSHVWPILPTAGDVYFLAREHLVRLRDGEVTTWPAEDPRHVFYRAYSIHGRLYFAQLGVGLLRLGDDDRLELVPGGAFSGAEELNAMWETPDGGGWLLTQRDGAYRFDGTSLTPFENDSSRWLDAASVQHGHPLTPEIYAVATIHRGLALVDHELKLLRTLDSSHGLSDDKIHFVTTDRDGYLWIGSDTAIDRVIVGSGLPRYDQEAGLAGRIYCLIHHQGRLIVGTSRGVYQGHATRSGWRFDPVPGLRTSGWSALSIDDALLIASEAGIYSVRFGRAEDLELTQTDLVSDDATIYLFRPSSDPDLVFASLENGLGILRRELGQWRWLGQGALLSGTVRQALNGPDGELVVYFSSQSRLAVLEFPDGLESQPRVLELGTRDGVLQSLDGQIYLVTESGIERYLGLEAARTGRAFESTSALDDLAELADGLFEIEARTETGSLWLETERGLGIVTFGDDGQASLRHPGPRPLTEVDAVVLDDSSGASGWIGTVDGLYRYHETDRPVDATSFESLMRRVVVRDSAGTERQLGGLGPGQTAAPPELPYTENRLRFEFAAPLYGQREEVLYQTRLDGLDTEWSAWRAEPFEDYTFLPEGDYTFRVRASSATGRIASPASYRFVVLPPWYRTPWAAFGGIVLATALVLAFVRVRTAQLRKIRRRLESQVTERTRELADEKNQVEAQARDLEIVNAKLAEENAHRRQLEVERAKLQARLEQANKLESLGQMAGGIAHDFNNFLMAILGNADLALDTASLNIETRERLEGIRVASERAAELCHQMLVYAGKGRVDGRTLDLNVIVRQTLGDVRGSLRPGVELEIDLTSEAPPISGDEGQLRQVVSHLVINAIEAIEGHGTVTVETGTRTLDREFFEQAPLADAGQAGEHVVLRVIDDGAGIDDEVQRRIFDPFFTTKFTGRGLGLAATLGIVRGHGGALEISSEKGRGTEIEVFLPVLAQRRDPGPEASMEELDAWRGRGRVLIVDDEEIVREVVTLMLRNTGFEVVAAAGGVEAIELYSRMHDDLAAVVLDLTMPGLDGVAVFERLQRIDADVPVILSSGYGIEDLVDRYLDLGFAAFVRKPYQTAKLRGVLKRVLDGEDALAGQTLD